MGRQVLLQPLSVAAPAARGTRHLHYPEVSLGFQPRGAASPLGAPAQGHVTCRMNHLPSALAFSPAWDSEAYDFAQRALIRRSGCGIAALQQRTHLAQS